MFYLGIDQHRKQLTVVLRDEFGNRLLQRQVSTNWQRIREFLSGLQERCAADGGYVAVVEVCGFNDWLLRLLREYGCQEVILIQPEEHHRKKTDRRDANRLSELLWVNRQRLLAGQHVQGLRRLFIASEEDQADRQLVSLRKRLTDSRTRLINRIKRILNKHNLLQECPTKGFQTKAAQKWVKELPLGELDRFEVKQNLDQWELLERELQQVKTRLRERASQNENAVIIATLYGKNAGYAALALAASIGPIDRFPRARSLANYWGLTPSCRSSGDSQRLGKITKQGSPIARHLLCQLTTHVLRRDAWLRDWYKRIKQRRGVKIARVAVMRRLATMIWHMLKHKQPYLPGDPARWKAAPKLLAAGSCEAA
jgi:transposase